MIDPADRPIAIDLNADLGEGCGRDLELLHRVTSASVACGAHAGARGVALATIAQANRLGVTLGAHPGYPDREGFGRRERSASMAEVEAIVRPQLRAIREWAGEAGASIRFVKAHGALYNQAQRSRPIAQGLVAAVAEFAMPILGLPGGVLEDCARAAGLRFVSEGFVDRRYRADGSLVPRGEPGAILDDPAEVEGQAVALARLGRETLCIHGDDPRAVALADRVRSALVHAGIAVEGFLGPSVMSRNL